MVAVSEYSWEEIAAPGFGDPARQSLRAAVAQVAAAASAKLPECNGRVEAAVKLVLSGDVTLGPAGTATVGSASDGQKAYEVRPGFCSCQDFDKAPHGGLCKHRLAVAITRRAQALLTGEVVEDAEPAPPVPALLPESLLPYVVHIKGKAFVQYGGLLTLNASHKRLRCPGTPSG